MPIEVLACTATSNWPRTSVTRSRGTSASPAIARPSFWTSSTSMCFSTDAAVCSPRVINRIAARSVPLICAASAIVLSHPVANYLCHLPRILSGDAASGGHSVVVAHRQRHDAAAGREHRLQLRGVIDRGGGGRDGLRP